jgi:hypothetical protein
MKTLQNSIIRTGNRLNRDLWDLGIYGILHGLNWLMNSNPKNPFNSINPGSDNPISLVRARNQRIGEEILSPPNRVEL